MALPTPGRWTSSLQNPERRRFCCVHRPGCGNRLQRPQETNAWDNPERAPGVVLGVEQAVYHCCHSHRCLQPRVKGGCDGCRRGWGRPAALASGLAGSEGGVASLGHGLREPLPGLGG